MSPDGLSPTATLAPPEVLDGPLFDEAPFDEAPFDEAPFDDARYDGRPDVDDQIDTVEIDTAELDTAKIDTAEVDTDDLDDDRPGVLEAIAPVGVPHVHRYRMPHPRRPPPRRDGGVRPARTGRAHREARLCRALVALAAGVPAGRVAHEVGFRSPSAFVEAFRRHTGRTPGAYFAPPVSAAA